MGCQQSTPLPQMNDPIQIGKSERGKPRTVTTAIGHTERLRSAQLKREQAKAASGVPPTVSLEVDEEEISNRPPMLNESGNLVPEEIVRRTSSSLNVSSLMIGNEEKGGKVFQVSVRKRNCGCVTR